MTNENEKSPEGENTHSKNNKILITSQILEILKTGRRITAIEMLFSAGRLEANNERKKQCFTVKFI